MDGWIDGWIDGWMDGCNLSGMYTKMYRGMPSYWVYYGITGGMKGEVLT
jgi:hypothetical protein